MHKAVIKIASCRANEISERDIENVESCLRFGNNKFSFRFLIYVYISAVTLCRHHKVSKGGLRYGNQRSSSQFQFYSSINMAAVGIHLGSTSASLALHKVQRVTLFELAKLITFKKLTTYVIEIISKDGRTEILTNDAGDRVTPALVACLGKEKVSLF